MKSVLTRAGCLPSSVGGLGSGGRASLPIRELGIQELAINGTVLSTPLAIWSKISTGKSSRFILNRRCSNIMFLLMIINNK